MEVKIVLGHAFGDEGKGVTVQWLCKKAIEEGKKPCVVRFSGGPQAGHTIFHNGVEHICSSFGSGVLLGVPTFLMSAVYVDPICLMNEYKVLREKGIEPKLSLNYFNNLITPYDVIAGRNNSKVRADGTCGKGLFATFKRNVLSEIDADSEVILERVSKYHRLERNDKLDALFMESHSAILDKFDIDFCIPDEDYDVIIFEGSQGLLLDMERGFYPHVTPSKVGLNGIHQSYLKDAEVYLVSRTYLTRHGNGYEPQIIHFYDLSNKHETNVENEFQGKFKTGLLEIPLLNRAYERHCIDNFVKLYNMKLNLVVTHTDVVMNDGDFMYVNTDDNINVFSVSSPDDICRLIAYELDYTPDKIFYNDSVESNLKQAII